MQEKEVMLSLTWNAPKEAFGDKNQFLFAGQSPDDAFSHITNAYRFCGASSLPSFSFFDVVKNPNIEGDLKGLKEHIDKNL
jgi:modulator of drug activity B